MPASQMLIEDYADVTVVTFTSTAILDAMAIEQLGRDLYHLVDQCNKQKLILDFTNVKFLASQAIGVLLQLQKKSRAIRGTIVLCGLRKELFKVFQLTGLDRQFKFFADDAAALAEFDVHVQ